MIQFPKPLLKWKPFQAFSISSNGIPDHNACSAPPRSTVEPQVLDFIWKFYRSAIRPYL